MCWRLVEPLQEWLSTCKRYKACRGSSRWIHRVRLKMPSRLTGLLLTYLMPVDAARSLSRDQDMDKNLRG